MCKTAIVERQERFSHLFEAIAEHGHLFHYIPCVSWIALKIVSEVAHTRKGIASGTVTQAKLVPRSRRTGVLDGHQ
jgi:hypothetical protein